MSRSGSQTRIAAIVFALIAGMAYGVGGAISQVVKGQGYEIAHIVVAQFVAAIVILGILVIVRFRPKMPPKGMVQLAIVGAISTISSYTYYLAIDMISVGQAVAIQFQYVWMAVVIQALFVRKMPKSWTIISSLLIIFGSVFASGVADEMMAGGLQMSPLGVFLGLICALFYALFIVLNGRVCTEYDPISRTFFMVIGGLIIALIALPFMGAGAGPIDVVGLIPGGIVMSLVMTIIPVVCLAMASSRIPGSLVAILTSIELPMSVLAGIVLLGETTTPLAVMGNAVIILAIVLSEVNPSTLRKDRQVESSAPNKEEAGVTPKSRGDDSKRGDCVHAAPLVEKGKASA